ncbi:MAG TPA: tRNA-binding protein [Candidatus Nanoarchaeia archaeon]|nr:tRNA-binding protein [Candidatus Nanoarchaeia archaeon]
MATWEEFMKIEIHVGTILEAKPFPEAKKPAYQLTIDFGPLGIKQSSAQITHLYTPEQLKGKQIIAVTNFPKKQIANFHSECLVLGGVVDEKNIILLQPERTIPNGTRIG